MDLRSDSGANEDERGIALIGGIVKVSRYEVAYGKI